MAANYSKEFVGIQELRLTCPIGDRGASLISDGLQSNSSLLSLSLVNCNISTAGLGDIFNAITGTTIFTHYVVTTLTIILFRDFFSKIFKQESQWMSAKNGKDTPSLIDPLHSPSIIIPWLGFCLYISLILLKRKLIEGTTGYDCINMQYWT